MSSAERRSLLIVLLIFGAASLVHFIHNAELIRDYPGLPPSWTRSGVYVAWFGMTAVGACGWSLLSYGHEVAGLLVLESYALLGLDSLGHYAVAPFSAHSTMMNVTILMEVATAAFVLGQGVKLTIERMRCRLRR
jgi:hypothetical protein